MLSLFIRNLVFTILQPGLVAGLIPYWIIGDKAHKVFTQQILSPGLHSIGIPVFLLGLIIMVTCIVNFAIKGRGTLSPMDPTQQLVVNGPYRYSRNPMYLGVILILIGEAIFFQSSELCLYTIFIAMTFNTFVVLVEEPRLRKHFGDDYLTYCKEVRRWM